MNNLASRRFYNREALDNMEFKFPVFEEGEPATQEVPKTEETKKTMFGTTLGKVYTTKDDKDEIVILKNASKSNKRFFLEIKSAPPNKTILNGIARCLLSKNENEFKLVFQKTEKYQQGGTIVVKPSDIADIQVIQDNSLRIILGKKSITIG